MFSFNNSATIKWFSLKQIYHEHYRYSMINSVSTIRNEDGTGLYNLRYPFFFKFVIDRKRVRYYVVWFRHASEYPTGECNYQVRMALFNKSKTDSNRQHQIRCGDFAIIQNVLELRF